VSASTVGKGLRVYEAVREHGDYATVHGNNVTPEEKARRVKELIADPTIRGPIYMNEDNNGRETTLETLALELASCDAVFNNGGSWGYMPWRQLQIFPFRHVEPALEGKVRNEMAVTERDPAYFKAVLEHVRGLVFASGGAVGKR
jgi:hypothetical protein